MSLTSSYDCLFFREFAAFINCELDAEWFTCGAAYLVSDLPPLLPLYDLDGALVCTVIIDESYRARPSPQTVTAVNDDLRFFVLCPQ